MKMNLGKILKMFLVGLLFARALCPSIAFAMQEMEEGEISTLHHRFLPTAADVENPDENNNAKKVKPHQAKPRDIFYRIEATYDAYIDKVCRVALVVAIFAGLGMVVLGIYHLWHGTDKPPSQSGQGLPPGMYASAPDDTDAVALMNSILPALISNITALAVFSYSQGRPSVNPGTEEFANALDDLVAQELLGGFVQLPNNTCPNMNSMQKVTGKLSLPPKGNSHVCAYSADPFNVTLGWPSLRLLGCTTLSLPDLGALAAYGCLNTGSWGSSDVHVMAIFGSKGDITVSGSQFELPETSTKEVTETEEITDSIEVSRSLNTKSGSGEMSASGSISEFVTGTKLKTGSLSEILSNSLPTTVTPTVVTAAPSLLTTPVPYVSQMGPRFIYWSKGNPFAIYAAPIDTGTGMPVISSQRLLSGISPRNGVVYGLSVDWVHNRLYYIDPSGLNVGDVVATNPRTVNNTKLLLAAQNLVSFALDPMYERIYWRDLLLGKVGKINLAVPSTPTNITTAWSFSYSIFIDTQHNKAYFDHNVGDLNIKDRGQIANVSSILPSGDDVDSISVDSEHKRFYWKFRHWPFSVQLATLNSAGTAITNTRQFTSLLWGSGELKRCDSGQCVFTIG